MLVDATYVIGGVVVVWSLVAIALAVLVFRRVGWARLVLMVSAGVAGLLCLLAVASARSSCCSRSPPASPPWPCWSAPSPPPGSP